MSENENPIFSPKLNAIPDNRQEKTYDPIHIYFSMKSLSSAVAYKKIHKIAKFLPWNI